MKIRLKLTLSYLLISALTTLSVGATAWWMLMQGFQGSVREKAFENFSRDVVAYINRHGSWEAAVREEAFPDFVQRRHRMQPLDDRPLPPPGAPIRSAAPFHFTVLSPEGVVLRGFGGHTMGETLPPDVLRKALPIEVNGQVAVLALPAGVVNFSPEDQAYVTLMQQALMAGMLVAMGIAVLLGILFGNRLGASLQELVAALGNMRTDGEIPEPVPVRSRDEVGLLATTFNRMSRLLLESHQELRASNETIRLQAEQLREQSLCDPLTGLHNRRYFNEYASRAIARAQQEQQPLCVMQADLDHFKSINDNYSHTVGDEVLKRTAEILRSHMRATDILARYGGEEFVAVFVDATLGDALARANQLREKLAANPWHELAAGLKVSMSAGLCDDLSIGGLEPMLHQADLMLYQAKKGGRNRVEPAAP